MLCQESLNKLSDKLKLKFKGLQELKLEFSTDNLNNPYIYLLFIKIKKNCREKGIGTKVMSEVIKYANVHQLPIVLWATDTFGSDMKRLRKFYQRLGFTLIKKDKDKKMIKFPD